jgi:hypothetical protein
VITAYLHVALALVSADEEDKLVEAPELIWVHGLQKEQNMEPPGVVFHKVEYSLCATRSFVKLSCSCRSNWQDCPAAVATAGSCQ